MSKMEKMEVNNADDFVGETTVTVEPNGLPRRQGLTKREWLAGMAMQGLMQTQDWEYSNGEKIAVAAVQQADALLAELAKGRA